MFEIPIEYIPWIMYGSIVCGLIGVCGLVLEYLREDESYQRNHRWDVL